MCNIAGHNEADFDASDLAEDAEAFFREPNASHLRKAIADMDAGRNIVFRDIIEDSADA